MSVKIYFQMKFESADLIYSGFQPEGGYRSRGKKNHM